MVPQNCSVSHILQNIFLCFQQNKDIHKGLELLEVHELHFWMNYHFNVFGLGGLDLLNAATAAEQVWTSYCQ